MDNIPLTLQLKMIADTIYIPGDRESARRARDMYYQALTSCGPFASDDERADAYLCISNASIELGDLEAAVCATRTGFSCSPNNMLRAILLTTQAGLYSLLRQHDDAERSARLACKYARRDGTPTVRDACEENLTSVRARDTSKFKHIYLRNKPLPKG